MEAGYAIERRNGTTKIGRNALPWMAYEEREVEALKDVCWQHSRISQLRNAVMLEDPIWFRLIGAGTSCTYSALLCCQGRRDVCWGTFRSNDIVRHVFDEQSLTLCNSEPTKQFVGWVADSCASEMGILAGVVIDEGK